MHDRHQYYHDLQASLEDFDSISLEEMGSVKLMNRVDTKYVTTVGKLLELLRLARGEYMVQKIDGECVLPYYTLYYDTDDFRMYAEHQRGKKSRKKVRLRRYESTGVSFLEVKSKNNKGRTKKKRMECGREHVSQQGEFITIHTPYSLGNLKECIENRFNRVTLVNKGRTERLTLDTSLRFNNLSSSNQLGLPDIAIIELKRDGNVPSPITDMLASLRIRPSGFSKYCMGMALTDSSLRQNRFKPRLRAIARGMTVERGADAWD